MGLGTVNRILAVGSLWAVSSIWTVGCIEAVSIVRWILIVDLVIAFRSLKQFLHVYPLKISVNRPLN